MNNHSSGRDQWPIPKTDAERAAMRARFEADAMRLQNECHEARKARQRTCSPAYPGAGWPYV